MESSPRHRSSDSKLRLMCSNGGHILPLPHDKSLRYVGGETRMVVVDRHTTLQDLTNRLSKTLFRSTATSPPAIPFTLKYQLPSEDLDSLISVTTDEDLENMIDECERLNSASRIRLFIFPTKPNSDSNSNRDSVSLIGSFLENPKKSEDWFLDALNGTSSGFSDTLSVNCLLDLEDEILLPEKKDVRLKYAISSGQDVHSIPDSPMLETMSSFGSASSTPSQVNLPATDDGGLMNSPAPVVVSGSPMSSATVIQGCSEPFLSCHEKLDRGLRMGYVKDQQQQSAGFDLASVDSLLSDLTITDQSSTVSQAQSSNYNSRSADPNDTFEQNTRIQNSAYLTSRPTTQVNSPRHQFHHQQPQYIHHHHPPVAVPVTSYYHHHPPTGHQNFMYYIPTTHPPQGYNFPLQQPQSSHADTRSVGPTKTELPVGVYRTSSGGPQLVRIPSGYQNQPQHVGFSEIHQPTQSMYYATPLSTGQQVRTAQP